MIHMVMEFAVHMAADTIISSKVQRSLPVVASLAHQKSNHFVQHHQHLLVQTAYKMAKKTGIDCGGPNCPSLSDLYRWNSKRPRNGHRLWVVQHVQLAQRARMEFKNGQETGVDCGGPNCPACPSSGSVQVTTLAGHYFENWHGWMDRWRQ
jgi:hypothetical protein